MYNSLFVTAENKTLTQVLQPYEENYPDIGGLVTKNWFYGAPSKNAVPSSPQKLLLRDYQHRAKDLTTRGRTKVLAHPGNVEYFLVHTITAGHKGKSANPTTEMYFAHFKQPDQAALGTTEPDSRLADRYAGPLEKRLQEVFPGDPTPPPIVVAQENANASTPSV